METQTNKLKWELIWYNMNTEVTRDIVYANTYEDAIREGYLLYGGADKAPAKLVSATEIK